MNKNFAVLFILILAASSLTAVVAAQTSQPSVPEFTMKYVDLSYDVPPTYGIDQFTGQNVVKQGGYHVDKQSAVFTIKNQPFTSYNDSSGNNISLYYNFRYKGHFGTEWRDYPFGESGGGVYKYSDLYYTSPESPKLEASNSEYTELALSLPFLFGLGTTIHNDDEIDFQVQALMGHIDYVGDGYYRYTGERSAWSNTQTIKVGQKSSTAVPDNSDASPLQDSQDSTASPNQTTDQQQNSTVASTADLPDSQNTASRSGLDADCHDSFGCCCGSDSFGHICAKEKR